MLIAETTYCRASKKALLKGLVLFFLCLFFSGQAGAVGTLIAHYKFDSCDWPSTGIIVDTVGTQDGTPTGLIGRDTTPTSGLKPDTCSAASFSGGAVDIDPLPVSAVAGAKTSVSFWMFWDGTNNVMPMGWQYHDLWLQGGSFGFNSGNSDIYGISSAGLAGGWHHVTAIFTNNDIHSNALYIDGVQQVLTQRSSTPNNSRAVVDPHLRISGWWGSNGYRFAGRLDEFKVYTGDVTQAQVDADRTATSTPCPGCPPPAAANLVAHYSFDSCDWHTNGIATNSAPTTIGSYDGLVSGSISRNSDATSGLKNDTCSSAAFGGGAIDINGLPLSTSPGAKTTVSFWMYWDGTNSVMPIGWNRHDLWFSNGNFGFNTAGGDIYGISSAGLANGWHHVVAVFTNNSVYSNRLYIDGTLRALSLRQGSVYNNWAVVDPHLRIGGWWANDGYRFSGRLDEVKVYDAEITQAEVNADVAYTSSGCPNCPPPPPATMVARYSFDDNWHVTGTLDDLVGTADGTRIGIVDRVATPTEGIKPDSCYGGEFNGGTFNITGLPLSTAPGDKSSVTFWMYWDGTNSVMPMGWYIHDLWFAIPHFGFNTGGGDIYGISSVGLANGWHHVAAVFTNNNVYGNQIFIDGVEQTLSQRRGTIYNNRAVVDSQLHLSGWGANSGYRFRGRMDEFRVYSGAVDQAQVLADMNSGCSQRLAWWQMEEAAWVGSPGEVADASGSGLNGTRRDDATTDSSTPAVPADPGTCRYGVFDGDGDYVEVPGFTDLTTDFTITAWMRTTRQGEAGQRIFADDEDNSRGGYALSMGDGGTRRLRFYSRGSVLKILDSDPVIHNNRWYFAAAVADVTNQVMRLHIYDDSGTPLYAGSQSFTGTWGTDSGMASIGGETDSGEVDNRFRGNLDEVSLHTSALTVAQIEYVMQETHSCMASALDHIEFHHDSSALTCQPESITIRACTNADCSVLHTGTVQVSLQPSGWVGGDTVTINNGSGDFELRHTTPEAVTLGVAGASPSPANAASCFVGGVAASCNLTFHDSGFVYDVPTQTSCATSGNLNISAVRTDLTSEQCVPAFQNRTETVQLWTSYTNPSSGSNQLILNSGGTDYTLVTSSPGTGVPLEFDSSGSATVTVTYPDAGQLTLDASFTGSGSEAGLVMTGSDAFVVKPDHIHVFSDDANAACPSGDHTCSAFQKAGEPFNLRVRGACADNSVTPNFQLDSIALSQTLVAPAGGAPGTLAVTGVDIAAADSGEHLINNQAISEVGVFTVTATPPANSYFGETVTGGSSENIGRFYPARLLLSSNTPQFNSACSAGANPFTYLGQDPLNGGFGFVTDPVLTVEPQNSAGMFTQNYAGDFWLLDDAMAGRSYTNAVVTTAATVSWDVDGGSATRAGDDYDAIPPTLTLSGDRISYSRPVNPEEPFAASVDLEFNAATLTDADGVCYDPVNSSCNIGDGDTAQTYTISAIAGTEQRYGQGYARDGYGTQGEIGDTLVLPIGAQHYSAGGWIVNSDDSCSQVGYTKVDSNITTTATPVTPIILNSGSGDLTLQISANPAPPSGTSVVTLDWPVWLPGPATATATFGIFRSDDRFIYWQEIE